MGRKAKLVGLSSFLLFAACNGFPDAVPITAAERQPEKYPSYTTVRTVTPVISTEGQRWVLLPVSNERVPSSVLTSLAIGGGGELWVSKWDHAPYDQLFATGQGGRLMIAAELR